MRLYISLSIILTLSTAINKNIILPAFAYDKSIKQEINKSKAEYKKNMELVLAHMT